MTDHITIENDSASDVLVWVGNGWGITVTSAGYIQRGRSLALPSGPRLFDVFCCDVHTVGLVISEGLAQCDRGLNNVNSMAYLKISDLKRDFHRYDPPFSHH